MTAPTAGTPTEFPRVLVVAAETFCKTSGTGLTMLSLFDGWPADRLFSIHGSTSEIEPGICLNQWRIDLSGHPLAGRFRPPPAGGVPAPSQAMVAAGGALHLAKRSLRRQIGMIADVLEYPVPDELLVKIRQFQPDVIYTLLGSIRQINLALKLSRLLRVPVVPHFMDDWPSELYSGSVVKWPLMALMRRRLRKLLAQTRQRMVISEAMQQAFEARYGGRFLPFMNAVDLRRFGGMDGVERGSGITLAYVGGLHLNRDFALREIAAAVRVLREQGLDIRVRIYTQKRFAALAQPLHQPPVMEVHDAVDYADVPEVLSKADILLHVESFDRRSARYARYSISTKIPECMAAGRPLFGYGPGDGAAMQYIRKSGVGVVVDNTDRRRLISALKALATSAEEREKMGGKGKDLARAVHDIEVQRREFRRILFTAAG